MRIYKILNNNVVIILDEHGQEQIVMGRGIAFKKKNGAELDPSQIDKVFTVNVPDINSKFQELVADIPIIYWEIVEEIVTYTKKNAYECAKKINHFVIERYNYLMSDEETIYLTIHIARIIYKNNR